jgi:integrase/recombinase XerD
MNYSTHIELKSKARADGRSALLLRISNGRKAKKRLNTGILVKASDFNSKAKFGKWIRVSDSMHAVKNNQLKEWLLKAETAKFEITKKRIEPTLENIIAYLKGDTIDQNINFIEFYYKELELMKKSNRVNTFHRHTTTIRKLEKYLDGKPLYFDNFNLTFLRNYEQHLYSLKHKQNTIYKELENIRSIFNGALRQDVFPQEKSPFLRFSMKKEKVFKEKLSYDEILKIEKLNLENDKLLDLTRDLFIAQFYLSGIRFGDVVRLKWSDIRGDRIVYRMNKTSVNKSIQLLEKVTVIFNKYKTLIPSVYIFPVLPDNSDTLSEFEIYRIIGNQNAIINRELKNIGKLINTDTVISTHIARHSFADFLRKKDINVYTISKAMGHSNLKITEAYLSQLDQEALDDAINGVFE